MNVCKICEHEASELLLGKSVRKIGEKGLATLTIRAAKQGLSFDIAAGDLVHNNCYLELTRKRSVSEKDVGVYNREKHVRTGFCYRTCCLFCSRKIAKLVPNEKVIMTMKLKRFSFFFDQAF